MRSLKSVNKRNVKNRKQTKKMKGGILTKKEKSRFIQTYRNRQNFIEPFIENIEAIRIGKINSDKVKIENGVNNIEELFNDDYLNKYINSLIPIRFNRVPALKEKYDPEDDMDIMSLSNKQKKKMIVNYISPLSVILDHIPKKYYTRLLDAFIRAGGNINLRSSAGKNKETALSNEIRKNNGYNIKLLLNNGADALNLSKEDSEKLVELVKNLDEEEMSEVSELEILPEETKEDVEEEEIILPVQEKEETRKEELDIISEPVLIVNKEEEEEMIENKNDIENMLEVSAPKRELLNVNSFNINEYLPDKVPSYWLPVFGDEQQMIVLKNRIMSVLVQDDLQKSLTKNGWISCNIVERLFPSYFVNLLVHSQVKQRDNNVNQRSIVNDDYNEYMLLCLFLLLLGIISEKMSGQNYNFIFKGGKAIQLVLSQIVGAEKYISEDIDILIVPQNGTQYDRESIINLGKNLAHLLKWFVSFPTISTITPVNLSIKDAIITNINDNVVKLALFKITGPKVLIDIGIHDIPENVRIFFENPQNFNFYIKELGENALYKCPKFDAIVNEKLFYFIKYLDFYNKFAKNIPVNAPEMMNVRDPMSGMRMSEYYMQKFGKALKALFSEKLKEDSQYNRMNEFQKKFQRRTIAEIYLNNMGIDKDISKQVLSMLGI
jgi:hypothetical protein